MSTARGLARILSGVESFAHPRVDLEQYPTPPEAAARLVHLADLRGDIADRYVIDLGSGPGILALGAAHRDPAGVVGVEIDPAAIDIARSNAAAVDPPVPVAWVRGDATDPPLCPPTGATVLTNPPFGAQRGHTHADRAFLAAASRLASVSYSVHNAGSREFVEAFVADRDGRVTDVVAVRFDLARQFDFHEEDATEIDVELYRIEWESTG